MRLRRIVLHGFKTFAERTEVRFEPGITAVVGANGSGKSNLVDAVRWALGETSARELRGTRLDEVIFAGGQGRDRMGMADVELVLDNEDGGMPVEDAEVALSRRVVRGGEVEYRINGQRARLRDLERLLGMTGLTQHGYSVVAQHDIEGIIEATPRQRRALVEQAAGVRTLRAACDDALRRLESVDVAVTRLAERLAEAEPRLAELAAEREAALEQRSLAERLAALRGSLAREEWRAARAQARQSRRRLEQAQRRLEAAREGEGAFTERVDAARQSVEAARDAQRRAADRVEAARVAAERTAGEARRFADRARGAILHRADARSQAQGGQAELDAVDVLLREMAGAVPRDTAAEATRRAVAEAEAHLHAAEAEAGELQGRLADAERDAAQAAQAAAVAQAAAAQRASGRALEARALRDAAEELAGARARAAEARSGAEAARDELAARDAAVRAAEEKRERSAAAAEAARTAVGSAEERLLAQREHTADALERAASLRGGAASALGGGGALAERAVELGAERLADCLRVADTADSAAVEAALEPHLGAWVVSDVGAALELLRGAGTREEVLAAGPAPPLGVPEEAAPVVGARSALSVVEVIDPRAAGPVARCLGGAWLVPDLATAGAAVQAGADRAVLPDGTVLTRAGARAGGRPDALARLQAARAAEAAAEAAAAGEEAVRLQVRGLTAAHAELAGALAAAEAELAGRRRELTDAGARCAAREAAAHAQTDRCSSLEAEARRRDAAVAQAAAAAEAAEAEAGRCEQRRRELGTRLEAARSAGAGAASRRDLLREQVAGLRRELADIRRQEEEGERRHAEAALRRRLAVERVSEAEGRIAAAETEVLVALARGRAAASEARGAAARVEDASELLGAVSAPLAEAEAALRALEAERGEVRVAVARAEDEVNAAQSETEVAEMRLAEQAEAVRGEIDEDEHELDPAAAERAEREIGRLERRIGAMGLVNALAPEQHAALAEHVGRLRSAHDDLAIASREVRHLAHRLGNEAARRFDAVFGAVGANFSELFAELFGGGRATLRLEEPDPGAGDAAAPAAAQDGAGAAPEEASDEPSGVVILAQPPGKRLQPLTHLSGGERALTALAMVLALQQVSPSPFYVFDEVDAPLDDAGVGRFTGLLARLSEHQQFILVTHNHLTMAAADCLYGVSSGGEGVSSVVSVRFPDREESVDTVGLLRVPLRRAAS